MRTPRRFAREYAVQGIYEWYLNRDKTITSIEKHIEENKYFKKADASLFKTLLFGTLEQADTLRPHIMKHLDRTESEVSPVERSILLLAAYELVCRPETPYPVIINEAIEIAKMYGGTEGHKFVNGVLDKMAFELREVEFQLNQSTN